MYTLQLLTSKRKHSRPWLCLAQFTPTIASMASAGSTGWGHPCRSRKDILECGFQYCAPYNTSPFIFQTSCNSEAYTFLHGYTTSYFMPPVSRTWTLQFFLSLSHGSALVGCRSISNMSTCATVINKCRILKELGTRAGKVFKCSISFVFFNSFSTECYRHLFGVWAKQTKSKNDNYPIDYKWQDLGFRSG